METHLGAALRTGDISIDELQEFVIHFAVYAGHPEGHRSRAALDAVWGRLQEPQSFAPTGRSARPGRSQLTGTPWARIAVRTASAVATIPARFGWTGAASAAGTTGSTQRTVGGWQAS